MTIVTFILTILFISLPSAHFIFIDQSYWYLSFVFLVLSPIVFYFFFILLLALFLFTLLFVKKNGTLYCYRGIRSTLNFLRRFLFYHKLTVLNKPPQIKKDDRVIIVANHKAKFDPLFLIQKVPFIMAFTPKTDLYKNKILGFILKKLGCVAIDRDNIRDTITSLKEASKKIQEDNIRYLIFPEGGTQNKESEALYNQKSGAYKVVLDSKAAILPVRIYNNLGFTPFCKKGIALKYGNLIPYQIVANLTTGEIADYVEKQMQELM